VWSLQLGPTFKKNKNKTVPIISAAQRCEFVVPSPKHLGSQSEEEEEEEEDSGPRFLGRHLFQDVDLFRARGTGFVCWVGRWTSFLALCYIAPTVPGSCL
jgi:hypothetical protein